VDRWYRKNFFMRKGWCIIIRKQATEFHGKKKKERSG
jgi:hypothetical protein